MTYRLFSGHDSRRTNIEIVGCGGTGAYVAEQVCRLQQQLPGNLTLIDHDLVEPQNLLRQNFLPADIDQPKSKVLAERLSNNFQRPIEYSTTRFTADPTQGRSPYSRIKYNTIMVGCVDNAAARAAMHHTATKDGYLWLVDSGNDADWGQILVGNSNQTHSKQRRKDFLKDVCHQAPAPLIQRPDLLETPDQPATPPQDCAVSVANQDQSPVINQVMAALVVQTLYLIHTGACTYISLYVDLPNGSMRPVLATPQNLRQAYQGFRNYQKRHPNRFEETEHELLRAR